MKGDEFRLQLLQHANSFNTELSLCALSVIGTVVALQQYDSLNTLFGVPSCDEDVSLEEATAAVDGLLVKMNWSMVGSTSLPPLTIAQETPDSNPYAFGALRGVEIAQNVARLLLSPC